MKKYFRVAIIVLLMVLCTSLSSCANPDKTEGTQPPEGSPILEEEDTLDPSSDEILLGEYVYPKKLKYQNAKNWLSSDNKSIPIMNSHNLELLKKIAGTLVYGETPANIYLFMDHEHYGIEFMRNCFIAVECTDSHGDIYVLFDSTMSLFCDSDVFEDQGVEFYCEDIDSDGLEEVCVIGPYGLSGYIARSVYKVQNEIIECIISDRIEGNQ